MFGSVSQDSTTLRSIVLFSDYEETVKTKMKVPVSLEGKKKESPVLQTNNTAEEKKYTATRFI